MQVCPFLSGSILGVSLSKAGPVCLPRTTKVHVSLGSESASGANAGNGGTTAGRACVRVPRVGRLLVRMLACVSASV